VQLEHRFTVPAPIDVAWEALNDVESVGSCFPGATVTSVEGEEFAGTCKIKLGPISMQYAGSGKFVERDESAHRAVIEAKGKDKRGNGTAAMTVTTRLAAEGDSTTVAIDTDLHITGKPAQFGRGVMQDVSDKLLGQFVACLETRLAGADTEPSGESGPAGQTVAEPAPGAGTAEPAPEPTPPPPTTEFPQDPDAPPRPGPASAAPPRGPSPRQDDAIDLGATVLPVLVKSYWKQGLGVLAVVALIIWWMSRG
jgi:carbon monoxide dehydrogenase subunit G